MTPLSDLVRDLLISDDLRHDRTLSTVLAVRIVAHPYRRLERRFPMLRSHDGMQLGTGIRATRKAVGGLLTLPLAFFSGSAPAAIRIPTTAGHRVRSGDTCYCKSC